MQIVMIIAIISALLLKEWNSYCNDIFGEE